jgi:hypothetical protein
VLPCTESLAAGPRSAAAVGHQPLPHVVERSAPDFTSAPDSTPATTGWHLAAGRHR